MSKIARPAVSAGIRFTKEHWKDIAVVLLKLVPVYLVVFGINLGVPYLMGPPTTLMQSVILYGTTILAYIGEVLCMLPLTVAAFRTAVLHEPFDRSIYSRVFNHREMNFFRWYLIILAIALAPVAAVMATMWASHMSLDNPAAISPAGSIALLLSIILCAYFMMRFWYVMPAVATDQPMNLSILWNMSQNKAWPIFKTMLLAMVIIMVPMGLVMALGTALFASMGPENPALIAIFGILGVALYVVMVIATTGLSLGSMAHVYKTLQNEKS